MLSSMKEKLYTCVNAALVMIALVTFSVSGFDPGNSVPINLETQLRLQTSSNGSDVVHH